MTGRQYQTKNFTWDDVHVKGAERLASIASDAGVSRFIHVSHINAAKESPSAYLRSKAAGEEAVKQAFDGATIVRPGPLYGHEDRFLNQMANWPLTWHVNHGRTKLRPTHVLNVAHALEIMLDAENTSIGQTFSLAGPKQYTITQLLSLVESLTFNKTVREGLNVPKFALKFAATLADKPWWPMLNPDEVERRYIDDLLDEPGTKSWADLGMEPDEIEDVALTYLRRYRPAVQYERPIEGTHGSGKLKKPKYHVVD